MKSLSNGRRLIFDEIILDVPGFLLFLFKAIFGILLISFTSIHLAHAQGFCRGVFLNHHGSGQEALDTQGDDVQITQLHLGPSNPVTDYYGINVLSVDRFKPDGSVDRIMSWHGAPAMHRGLSWNAGSFSGMFRETLSKLISTYKDRRNWPDTFLGKISEQAHHDAKRSHFFAYLHTPHGQDRQELKGSLKLIRSTNGDLNKLPVEINLGIELPYNGDKKFELANFFIEKASNKNAFSSILVQLMVFASRLQIDGNHYPDQFSFFTYADPYSLRMYRSLGFAPVAGFEAGIQKDGVTWVPMGISSNGILDIPDSLARSRQGWRDSELLQLKSEFQNFQKRMNERSILRVWSLPYVDVSLMPKTYLDIQASSDQFVLVVEQKYRQDAIQVPIPKDLLSLNEGQTFTLFQGNIKYDYSYKNGILEIRSLGQYIRIWVDESFLEVTKLESSTF